MGMYDIIEGITVYCPQCGKPITEQFQTKDLAFEDRFLNHYKVGDTLSTDRENEDYIEIHSICEKCGLFTSVYINVVDDILTDKFN